MSLHGKTLIAIIVTVIALTMAVDAISSRTLLGSFAAVEEKMTRANVKRAEEAISDVEAKLSTTTSDWAGWDDTYNYIQARNSNYKKYLDDPSLSDINVTLAVWVAPSGKIVFGTGFDLRKRKKVPMPQDMAWHVSPGSPLTSHASTTSSKTGILQLHSGPVLVAARPILTTRKQGPIRGTLIFGRSLDAVEIKRLAELTDLDLSVYNAHAATLPPDVSRAYQRLSQGQVAVEPISDTTIAGYSLLKDVYGKPALILRVGMPRGIYQQGLLSLRYLILQILLAGSVFGGLTFLILQKMVLGRLSSLSEDVSAISASGDVARRVVVQGQDELARLASLVNAMLQSLNQAQQSLQESEDRFRAFMDHSPALSYVKDETGRYMYVNRQFEKRFRLTRADWEGKDDFELWPVQIAQSLRKADEQVLSGNKAIEVQETTRVEDGSQQWLSYKFPIHDGAGRRLLAGISVDVTERKRAEEAVLESEQRFRHLVEQAADAVFVVDADCRFVDVNPCACRSLGYTREELLSLHIWDIEKVTPRAFIESMTAQLTPGNPITIEGLQQRKDGTTFPVEISIGAFESNGRRLSLALARDISERKQTEEALRQAHDELELRVMQRTADLALARDEAERANRAKSEFLSRMSHELRTPLNAILGFSQLLELDKLTPDQEDSVAHITTAGNHLLELINEVLDLSRIEIGQISLSPQAVSIPEVMQEAVDLVQHIAERRHIQFVFDPTPETSACYVLADRQRLKQVLLNLVSNAVKYNRDGGSVTLSYELSGLGHWRIKVSDSGPGIPPEKLGRLFVFFDRLDAEQSTVEGTGIGLALSKRLVEAMQGIIGVDSAMSQGSTFWVELPKIECPLENLERTLAANTSQNRRSFTDCRRTVLYIEDNLVNFRLVERILSRWPELHLITAMQGTVGLEMAREHHPDLILLDLHLPDMEGDEVFNRLQAGFQTRAIPVAILSADATPGRIGRLLAAGVRDYLTKPIKVQELLDLIESLFEECIKSETE